MNEFEKEGFKSELSHLIRRYGGDDEDLLREAASLLEQTQHNGKPKPCCMCGTLLECVGDNWSNYQPYDGCEIKIHGSYGSKHDLRTYQGIICDDCVNKLKPGLAVKDMDWF